RRHHPHARLAAEHHPGRPPHRPGPGRARAVPGPHRLHPPGRPVRRAGLPRRSRPAPTAEPAGPDRQTGDPMIRAKSALAGAGALVLAGALAAGVAHAAGPAAARPSTAHPARTTWVGSWGSVPTTVPPASTTMFSNQTIRQTVHLSIGGSALQVRFSNEFGTAPLVIGEAHVGLAAGSQPSRSVAPGSDRRLSF